jgi:hypothetical protein
MLAGGCPQFGMGVRHAGLAELSHDDSLSLKKGKQRPTRKALLQLQPLQTTR